jgi:hypothetical protein
LDHPVIAKCQLHQLRNVRDKLPERLRGPVQRRMRAADPAPPPWTPRRSWPRWPASWTGPIPARQRACVRGSRRPSRCCGWRSHRPWRHAARHQRHPEHTIELPRARRQRPSAGGTARWRCAGAQPGWSRPASSSAVRAALQAEAVGVVIGPCEDREVEAPEHGAAIEARRNSGHPRDSSQSTYAVAACYLRHSVGRHSVLSRVWVGWPHLLLVDLEIAAGSRWNDLAVHQSPGRDRSRSAALSGVMSRCGCASSS